MMSKAGSTKKTRAGEAPPPAASPAAAGRYLVLARKYRPQTFDEVIGQEPIVRTLKNAIALGRIHHAYCFTGSRGIGKTSLARILAKALNCIGPDGTASGPTPEPCGVCDVCRDIIDGRDLDMIEIDGASNRGVEEARELRTNIRQKPVRARFRVYVIDEVHMLTKDAFNTLLKTLEEPPPHVKFIFATTEVHKLPETILSRCQRFDFRRIPVTRIAAQLATIAAKEGIEADPEAFTLLARIAEGGMRDAESHLDQAIAFCPGRITVAEIEGIFGILSRTALLGLLETVAAGDIRQTLQTAGRAYEDGLDLGAVLRDLVTLVRDAIVVLSCGAQTNLVDATDDAKQALAALAERFGLQRLMLAMDVLAEGLRRMRATGHPRIAFELTCVHLCHLEQLAPLDRLIDAVEGLPPVSSGSAAPGSPPARTARPPASSGSAAPTTRRTLTADLDRTLKNRGTPDNSTAARGSDASATPGAKKKETTTPVGAASIPAAVPAAVPASPARTTTPADSLPSAAEPIGAAARAIWERALARLRQSDRAREQQIAALLESCRLAAAHGDEFVIAAGSQLHRDLLDDAATRAAIAEALSTEVGAPLTVRVLEKTTEPAGDRGAASDATPAEARATAASANRKPRAPDASPGATAPPPGRNGKTSGTTRLRDHPTVRRIAEVLEGQIVRVDRRR